MTGPHSHGTPPDAPGHGAARGIGPGLVALAVVVIALGGYERWWMSAHTIGTLTSDGSVIGLMALHLLHHGQFPAYMWGQSYGGSLEMLATAGLFFVFGVGTSQLIATTALTSFLAALAMWRASRRFVGEPAALLGALALWAWPVLFTWRSIKPGGSYVVGLALAWCAVGYLVRIKRGETSRYVLVAAGVACGLAFWTSPMTLQLLVPALLWSFGALRALGRRFAELLGGAIVGGAPAIYYGATHALANLSPPNGNHVYVGLGNRFVQFFTDELPIAASLRVEGSLAWVGGAFGIVATVLLGVGLLALVVAVLRHRAPRCELPVLALVLLPVLYTLNPLANHVGQGRYVLLGSTMGAVLVGVGLDNLGGVVRRAVRTERTTRRELGVARLATSCAGVALLAGLGVAAMGDQPGARLSEFPVGGVPMPPNDAAIRSLVASHHVHDAFTGYWMAYRLMFETDEHVVVTPISLGRYPPIRAAVWSSPHPAYLFLTLSPTMHRFVAWCESHHVTVAVSSSGAFTLVEPATRVVPSDLPRDVLGGSTGAGTGA
jgi:hypothetical protein